jgi:hypothetical protein
MAKATKKTAKAADDGNNENKEKLEALEAKATAIRLVPMLIRTIYVPIMGDTTLITHAWSEKAKKMMLDKQMGKAPAAREKKDPDKEFRGAMYLYPKTHPNFPEQPALTAAAFKGACVNGVRQIPGMTMTAVKGLFFTMGLEHTDYVPIFNAKPRNRCDMVRLESGVADIRFRPEYDVGWCTLVPVRFDESTLSLEQLLHIFNKGGFHGGVCEWRPSAPKSATGSHGQFHVASEDEVKNFPPALKAYWKKNDVAGA